MVTIPHLQVQPFLSISVAVILVATGNWLLNSLLPAFGGPRHLHRIPRLSVLFPGNEKKKTSEERQNSRKEG